MRTFSLFFMLIASVSSGVAFASEPSNQFGQLMPADKIGAFAPPSGQEAPLAPPILEPGIPDDATCRDPIKIWWFRCFSNNAAGWLFGAVGREPQETQDRAMNRCFLLPSNLCRPLGCRIEY